MIWIKQRDITHIVDMFNRATEAGDALVAGELFDTLIQITETANQHVETDKSLDGMQWKRIAELTMAEIEKIVNNPMLTLQSQLILGRKVLVLVNEEALQQAAQAPIIPSV